MSIGTGGTFSGSKIWLSGNNVDATYRSGPTILEMTQTNTINDLGAVITDPFFYSENKVSTKPKSFAIAITKYVEVVVYKLITPNDDGYNNVLFIDGIDQNPKNEVTLLDRWGVQIKTWKNVTNALFKDEPDTFKKLPVGNYICVVKYEEPTTGTTKTVQQMISLLK
jgi:gliding motility-associated-like protein